MSAEIVPFSPKPLRSEPERLVWVCKCGCTTFRIYSDGMADCASCDHPSAGAPGGWRERLPEAPLEPQTVEPDSFAVKSVDEADVFLRKHAKRFKTVSTAVVLHEDGTVSTWQRHDAPLDWIKAQLDHAKNRLVR